VASTTETSPLGLCETSKLLGIGLRDDFCVVVLQFSELDNWYIVLSVFKTPKLSRTCAQRTGANWFLAQLNSPV
jgi:hypothetical protein